MYCNNEYYFVFYLETFEVNILFQNLDLSSKVLKRNFKKGSIQWRIQDFPQGGAPTSKIAIIFQIFAENCMKMKEFGPRGGGGASLAPPLWIRQWH